MAEDSKIQWTDATWNPWHGCTKVSPGCKFCYMFRDKERYGQDPTTVIRSKANFNKPLDWAGIHCMAFKGDRTPKLPEGSKIFTCSWSDFFIEESDDWRNEAWDIIKQTPQFQYQILTKRPERIKQCLPDDWGEGYPNVWIGVSGEDEKNTHIRLRILLSIPAKVKFLSAEPLIESIHSQRNIDMMKKLDWIIIGGESGNDSGKYRYRPLELDSIESILDCLSQEKVKIFVKQLGTHLSKKMGLKDRHGGDLDEWPENIRVREFPEVIRIS